MLDVPLLRRNAVREALADARRGAGLTVSQMADATGHKLIAIVEVERFGDRPIPAPLVAKYHVITRNTEIVEVLAPRAREQVRHLVERKGGTFRFAAPRVGLTGAEAADVRAVLVANRTAQRLATTDLVRSATARAELEGFEAGRVTRPREVLIKHSLLALDLDAEEMFRSVAVGRQIAGLAPDRTSTPVRELGNQATAALQRALVTARDDVGLAAPDLAFSAKVPLWAAMRLDARDFQTMSIASAGRMAAALDVDVRRLTTAVPHPDVVGVLVRVAENWKRDASFHARRAFLVAGTAWNGGRAGLGR